MSATPRTAPTPRLAALWTGIDAAGGPTHQELSRLLASRAGDAVRDYVINPDRVVLCAPRDRPRLGVPRLPPDPSHRRLRPVHQVPQAPADRTVAG